MYRDVYKELSDGGVIQRQKLDITFFEIGYLVLRSIFEKKEIHDSECNVLEGLFNTNRKRFLSLSVRTTWDLFLSSLSFEKKSEIILTSITIPNMIDIIKAHGLVPISISNDEATLSISVKEIEKKISSRTKVILIAHLFGAMTSLEEVRKLKEKYPHILVVEDCAQGFRSPSEWCEHQWIDLSLISFGTIKTMSCFRGALSFIKDEAVFDKMDTLNRTYRHYTKLELASMLLKGLFLKIASEKIPYTIIFFCCRVLYVNADRLLSRSIKGFPGDRFLDLIRRQLPSPIRSLILKKLMGSRSNIDAKRKNGDFLKSQLHYPERVIGYKNKSHHFWVFPLKTKHGDRLIKKMRKIGVDATKNASHMIKLDSEKVVPLQNIVYIPVHDGVTNATLTHIAAIINQVESGCTEH